MAFSCLSGRDPHFPRIPAQTTATFRNSMIWPIWMAEGAGEPPKGVARSRRTRARADQHIYSTKKPQIVGANYGGRLVGGACESHILL